MCFRRSWQKSIKIKEKLRFAKIQTEKKKNLLKVINSNLKNKKLHFDLLIQSWKNLFSLRVNNSMVKVLFFGFWVTNSGLKNKKSNFELLTRWVTFYFFTFELRTWIDKWKKYHKYYSSNIREPLEINTIPYFF